MEVDIIVARVLRIFPSRLPTPVIKSLGLHFRLIRRCSNHGYPLWAYVRGFALSSNSPLGFTLLVVPDRGREPVSLLVSVRFQFVQRGFDDYLARGS